METETENGMIQAALNFRKARLGVKRQLQIDTIHFVRDCEQYGLNVMNDCIKMGEKLNTKRFEAMKKFMFDSGFRYYGEGRYFPYSEYARKVMKLARNVRFR